MTKDSLIRGTLVLTLAAFISRFLGVFQKLPLNYMLLSDVGTYGIAFNIYSLILIVATAGIPSALSKTVSAKLANGCEKEARELYASAILYAILIGFLAALLLYIAAPLYASWVKSPSAVSSIRAIAPTLLFFPLIAIMRGHFQARQHMTPNAISQIVEQIFRVASSLLLAWVFLSVNTNAAAAGASFGAVVGGIGALFIMVFYSKRCFRKPPYSGH
ncbi:oligosaccharide flippase family protein [Paenibacillus larvae]|nr:oligosaccharide flippase family protein [Paenibacillus larvae]MDT2236002.1 oligosaccharide flippase family protein [Paenibacillus larvae]